MENQRRVKKRSHGGAIATMLTLLILMIFSVVILFLPEQEATPTGTPKTTPTPELTNKASQETEYPAVVLGLDKENKILTVYGVETDEKKNLVYTGGTTFYDGYGVQVTAGQLEIGGLYIFTIDTENDWISTGKEAIDRSENKIDNGMWEKTGVDSITIEEGKITFRNQNYRYSDGVCVMSNGKQIALSDINTKTDVLTVRGNGATIYEIVVTKGHGTISLKNHEDFVGGMIAIGNTWVDTVSEAGTYVVKEGTYTVSVSHGEYGGTEQILVARDTVAEFDLYEYGRGPIQTCELTFTVEPLGATLYIDGVKTPYTDGVQLDYGTYKIEFAEGGYISHVSTLLVEEPTLHITVYLTEKPAEPTQAPDDPTEPTPTPTAGPTETPVAPTEIPENPVLTPTPTAEPTKTPETGGQMSVSIQELGDYKLDLEYAVYIIEPEGAEVYLDGIYIGIVPLDFEKIIGTYELRIVKKDGSESKYQCEGLDNETDSWYSFP